MSSVVNSEAVVATPLQKEETANTFTEFQTYNSSVGTGFPYNIPRKQLPLDPKSWDTENNRSIPKQNAIRLYSSDDNSTTTTSSRADQGCPKTEGEAEQPKVSTTSYVSSFEIRPTVAPGRVLIARDRRKLGYGFSDDNPIDSLSVTNSELRAIRHMLREWVKETKYESSMGEGRVLHKNTRARILGMLSGSMFTYAAAVRLPTLTAYLTRHTVIGVSVAVGLLAQHFCGNLSSNTVIRSLLQMNTPLGYKTRQFLLEIRDASPGQPCPQHGLLS